MKKYGIQEIHQRQMNIVKKSQDIINNRSFIPLNMKNVSNAVKNVKRRSENRPPNCLEVTMGIKTH